MKCDYCHGVSISQIVRIEQYRCHLCLFSYKTLYFQYKEVCTGCLHLLFENHQQEEHASVDLV